MRKNGRRSDQLRPIKIVRAFTDSAPGSVLIEAGGTKVLCTATFTDTLPPFLVGQGSGWITAEYGMLPGSTHVRKQREARNQRVDGRTMEIQRLIGRSLRGIVNLKALPEKSLWVDCDVLSADGGTRTLSVTGAYVAVFDAMLYLEEKRQLPKWPLKTAVAAVSVGILNGEVLLDLGYDEDSQAEVDLNVVMTAEGEFIEVQGSAEKRPFSGDQLQAMLDMGRKGCADVLELQRKALGLTTAPQAAAQQRG